MERLVILKNLMTDAFEFERPVTRNPQPNTRRQRTEVRRQRIDDRGFRFRISDWGSRIVSEAEDGI